MHDFLSDEWFAAAEALREKYADQLPEPALEIRINQIITDVPFGDGTVEAYLDTSSGSPQFMLGAVDEPDAIVTTDYQTARIMLIDQDPALAMQAFMEGRVRVQGDMMKLMAAQAAQPRNEAAEQLAAELRAITA
ncbi:MAG: SCP2 sterol-binding domain-containing protein [Ilumatobacter sp.]|nr:SCP2 sterol-binding domain-containing protein [Ilumatobacter sp.]